MPPLAQDNRRSFAHVYDALYAGEPAFIAAQAAFLAQTLGPPPLKLLDLGCGTGIHLAALAAAAYSITGVDIDPLMLAAARRKLPLAPLVLADIRRLPFAACAGSSLFEGALCLESPLAYLLTDDELVLALTSIRAALKPAATLMVDVYDYPGTLGTRPKPSPMVLFNTPASQVGVQESHHYEKQAGLWTMRQRFEIEENGERYSFEVVHRLKIRTTNEYAHALETLGFEILQALPGYPGAPRSLADERRIILVARAKVT